MVHSQASSISLKPILFSTSLSSSWSGTSANVKPNSHAARLGFQRPKCCACWSNHRRACTPACKGSSLAVKCAPCSSNSCHICSSAAVHARYAEPILSTFGWTVSKLSWMERTSRLWRLTKSFVWVMRVSRAFFSATHFSWFCPFRWAARLSFRIQHSSDGEQMVHFTFFPLTDQMTTV